MEKLEFFFLEFFERAGFSLYPVYKIICDSWLFFLKYLKLIFFSVCVCLCGGVLRPQYTGGGSRTTSESQISRSSMWVPGIKPGLSTPLPPPRLTAKPSQKTLKCFLFSDI